MIKRLLFVGMLASSLTLSAYCGSNIENASKKLDSCLAEIQKENVQAYNQIHQKLTNLKEQVAHVNNQMDKTTVVRIFEKIIEVCWLITKTVIKIAFVISATAILLGVVSLLYVAIPAGFVVFLGLCSLGWYSMVMHLFVLHSI